MIKTLKNLFKQDKEKFVVPKSVQAVIPIKTIWEDGVFLVGKNKYAKTFKFEDINYAVASREDKEAMFLEYSELLNALDSGATTKITINNRRLNKADFEQTILIPMADDGLDKYRNAYTPVSAEVEAYDPLIRQYASQHGIPEYVELIKAVMMQESGGRGNDPMQASECGYNTRYPNTPNGITDPEYSIDVGIQNLADCLNAAEVENPVDMEHIKLALQGYNFGNGYISWAKNNYGGYSYANAVEFSAIQAERLGWDSYGDTQYVAHVLRYYPYGRAFTSGGNQAIVEVALTQLGNVGGEPYWSWCGFDSRVEWCACFVSWCANQCDYIESGIIPKFTNCVNGSNWFKGNGQWQDRNYEPQAGNIIFFDWKGDGITDHVGIVEKCENGTVYTVEGNSGDECKQRSYPVGSSVIYGYGIPVY